VHDSNWVTRRGAMAFTKVWSIEWSPARKQRGFQQLISYVHHMMQSSKVARSLQSIENSVLENIESKFRMMLENLVIRLDFLTSFVSIYICL